jgi:serpin B
MILMVPNRLGGLPDLEGRLSWMQLASWLEELQRRNASTVRVCMPTFNAQNSFELADILARMGMPRAFHGADFSGMTGNQELFISNVIHQARVTVNEEGTEAAAGTAVVMKRGGVTDFVIDRPFLFLIIDKPTQSILFVGRVTDPTL